MPRSAPDEGSWYQLTTNTPPPVPASEAQVSPWGYHSRVALSSASKQYQSTGLGFIEPNAPVPAAPFLFETRFALARTSSSCTRSRSFPSARIPASKPSPFHCSPNGSTATAVIALMGGSPFSLTAQPGGSKCGVHEYAWI